MGTFGAGKLLEFEYWQHIEYFPNHHPMPAGLLDELLALLIQQHIGALQFRICELVLTHFQTWKLR